MLQKTHLKIQDYFKGTECGHLSAPNNSLIRQANGLPSKEFDQILSSYRVSEPNRKCAKFSGLTITDYLANRVPARRYEKKAIAPSLERTENEIATTLNNKIENTPKSDAPDRVRITRSINRAAEKYGVPAELIKGVIQTESSFRVSAVSPAGAKGLMQLMPGTAKALGVTNPFDIDQNIDGGARYLKKMLGDFAGDVKMALAAYNAGPGAVRRYNGIPPYPETKAYVNRVLKYCRQMA